jgi:hypothetical protein
MALAADDDTQATGDDGQIGHTDPSVGAPDAPGAPRHWVLLAAGYFALRVLFLLSSHAFETPDTESYRAGQGLRPPLSSALLSWLGDAPYVLVSVLVSTAGFLALAIAMWNPARRRWSWGVIAVLGLMSVIPAVTVYEHWLVPDSLLVGLSLLGLALAWRHTAPRWQWWAFGAVCVLITLTKEVGVAVVVLVALVLAIRRSWKAALAAVLVCGLLAATVVLPASNRTGTVLWHEPRDTELTMERFRVIVSALMWSDLSPELTHVSDLSKECGMDIGQLISETFLLTKEVVAFKNCPDLWAAVDDLSQADILVMHAQNPKYVRDSIERGFVPSLYAMTLWSDFKWGPRPWLSLDRWLAGLMALLPLVAIGVSLARGRGRRLAFVALGGTGLALAAALVDPTGQERHALIFRVVAAAIALMSLTEATAPSERSATPDEVAPPVAVGNER